MASEGTKYSKEERSYRIFVAFLASCIVFYVCMSFALRIVDPQKEPFFFFQWFVFSRVPQREQPLYDIRLLSVDGEKLREPLSLTSAKGLYTTALVPNPEIKRRIGVFARSLNAGSGPASTTIVDELITVQSATYELDELVVNPIEYWKDGSVLRESVLGTFAKRP